MAGAGSVKRGQAAVLLDEEKLDVGHTELQEPTRASVPGVSTGLRRNRAPVNCQSTSFQMANLHLENYFTWRKKEATRWRKGEGGW